VFRSVFAIEFRGRVPGEVVTKAARKVRSKAPVTARQKI